MEIKRLKWLVDRCIQEHQSLGAVSVEAYFLAKTTWTQYSNGPVSSSGLVSELEKARQSPDQHHRQGKSKQASFYLGELDAVVRLEFPSAPSKTTRDKTKARLAAISQAATDSFDVAHHPITGLLSRKELDRRLQAWCDQTKTVAVDPTAETTSAAPAICVIGLDIDYFKQVNDSYGHGYGDYVLRAFAHRIEREISQWASENPSAEISLACHPSGEEFLCAAGGILQSSAFTTLAERLRAVVAESPLPSDDECKWLRANDEDSLITIPPIQARAVTCSVGYVITGASAYSGLTKSFVASLAHRADQALYKSKSLGRNRCTEYAHILKDGGRVLEHRRDLDVVAIDIGTDVGVQRGQEFRVYPPFSRVHHSSLSMTGGQSGHWAGILD